jgi:hypothetical protein
MSNENNNKINSESTEENVLTQKELDSVWMDNYKAWLEFKEEFGHQRFPRSAKSSLYKPKFESLYDWSEKQSHLKYAGNLSEWKYNLLVTSGFDFEAIDKIWNENIKLLKEFKKIYGHCNVSRYDEKYGHISNYFLSIQNNKEKLHPNKIAELSDLGFDWSRKNYVWNIMYRTLKQYKKNHGHPFVVRDYTKPYKEIYLSELNKWCGIQRFYFKRGVLPLDKIQLLEKLEFDFNSKKPDFLYEWEANIYKLQKYQIKYGDFKVPNKWKEDVPFTKWLNNLLENKRTLHNWQIGGLIQIGFDLASSDEIWEQNYQALITFKERQGHCDVKSYQNKLLWNWVDILRKARSGFINCNLPKDRIEKLDSIGFVWEPKNDYWLNQLNQ